MILKDLMVESTAFRGRLIVFALYKPDEGTYYNLFTMLEVFPKGMPSDAEFPLNHKKLFLDRVASSDGNKEKVIFIVKEISVTDDLGFDTPYPIIIDGDEILPVSDNFKCIDSGWFRKGDDASEPDGSGIFCRINYRTPSHPPLAFRFDLLNHDGNPIGSEGFFTRGEFLASFDFKYPFDRLRISVLDPDGSLIDYYDNVSFIRSINFNMQVLAKRVEYSDGKGKSKVVDKYVAESSSTGTQRSRERIRSLFNSSPEFSYEKFEKSLDFVFFDGDKDNKGQNVRKAKECVQRILNSVRNVCYICDIFFNAGTFSEFLLDLSSLTTAVRILTSKEHLNGEARAELAEIIRKSNEVVGHNIECHLLRGKAALHDRIIIADSNVWMIGCSLNEFGVRASTLIRVPRNYAGKILQGVLNWWNNPDLSENLS